MTRLSSVFAARRGRWRPTWWGAGLARPARGAAVGLSRPRGLRQAHRHARRGLGRLPVDAGRGRRRRAADLRHMGREPAAAGVRGLGGGADAAHRDGSSGEAPARADHRLSARGGAEDRALRRGDWRAGRWLRHRHGRGAHARSCRSAEVVVQGNLDPIALVAGGQELERQVDALLQGLAGVPHIFNLGHGILPETPPENVADSWSWSGSVLKITPNGDWDRRTTAVPLVGRG